MILTAGICDDSVLNLNTFSSVVRWPNNVSDIYEKNSGERYFVFLASDLNKL